MKCKKVIMKYREIARYVNPEIKVQKDSEWLSYIEDKIIGVPMAESEEGQEEFNKSIYKALPSDKKELIDIIPDFMWSFLHELGHIQKGKRYFDTPQRAITKGQAVVLYDDDIVVGGGTISETESDLS